MLYSSWFCVYDVDVVVVVVPSIDFEEGWDD
jgi:hypothetical protein